MKNKLYDFRGIEYMDDANDFIRNSLIALTGTVPYVGGPISFLLDKYIPSEAERKRNEFISKVSDDLEELREKVDAFNFETPEFYSIFTKLLRHAVEEYRDEKINAFRNLTMNIVLEPEQFDKIDFFARLVIVLVPDEIVILRTFYLLDVKNELKNFDTNPNKRDIYKIITDLYGVEDRLYINALMTDLGRYRLVLANNELKTKFPKDGMFLSKLGKEFTNYIFSPKEGAHYGFQYK